MMDLHEIAEALTGPQSRLRLRQGTVVAANSDGTMDVKIAGSDTTISDVKCLSSVCPIVGTGVWLATDGMDLFAIGTMEGPAYCSLLRTTNLSVASGTAIVVSFATSTRKDNAAMWSSSNPTRITCTVPGLYHLYGGIYWEINSTGYRSCRLLLNGDTIAGSTGLAPNIIPGIHAVSVVYPLATGDYVELQVRQDSGGNLNAVAVTGAPLLTATWLRPPA